MTTVNIHDARTHFSRLVEQAGAGDEIIIAKAGKPVARLVGLAQRLAPRRLGLMAGQFSVLADFDAVGAAQIQAFFGGELHR
jgi:prevent-host-death family protein